MEYISTAEIAEKWGIKQRQVQKLLADERIYGAVKYGRFWMIPIDAEKPADLRRGKEPPKKAVPPAAPVSNGAMTKATVDALLKSADIMELAPQDAGGMAYLRGDFEKVMQIYHDAGSDDEVRLRVASLGMAAAISLGEYSLYLEIETYLKGVAQNTEVEGVAAIAELLLASGRIAAMAPRTVPDWIKQGDFSRLFEGVRLDAIYLRAKYFQCVGDYTSMLAVAQTTLSLCDVLQEYTHPGLYLKMLCATACYYLHRVDEATKWLLDALHSGLPYGFTTPFAELLPLFGGVLERLIKQEYPEYFTIIYTQWERTYNNWLIFHNRFTEANLSLILSLREQEMVFLAARGIPRKEIAAQFHLSLSRQKAIMNDIYAKLGINSRRELSKYVLSRPENSTFSDVNGSTQNTKNQL